MQTLGVVLQCFRYM